MRMLLSLAKLLDAIPPESYVIMQAGRLPESENKKIDLFTLYVLFSQKRSQGNLSLSLFRINYAQICTWIGRNLKGQFCSVLSHDLYWENKTYKVKRSIPGLKSDRGRLRNLSCCRLRESFWNKTVIYKVVACGRW